jgi:hypothetical protein
MSTGRRAARLIMDAIDRDRLEDIVIWEMLRNVHYIILLCP